MIVAPKRDLARLLTGLPDMPNIDVTVKAESDFFPFLSRFYLLPGWYRQQIVKLQVPAMLGWDGYLTLDSDVVCVGDFDRQTFLQNGRAVSRWEPKKHHPWWHEVSKIVGIPYDSDGHGLSVTPNLLHGDLARQTLAYFGRGRLDAVTHLGLRLFWRIGFIPWTEYSLYTSVAELEGNLYDYHLDSDNCYDSDVHLFSERSCVWKADDFERMATLPNGRDPGGKFIIVQSFARIPIERVREYCLSFAG